MAYYGNQPIAGETNSFKVLDDISSYTKTFDGSSAAVVSTSDDTLTFYDHRFIQGQRVTYGKGSGGTVVTGLTDATVYYVIREDKDTIKLATSASNAAGLTAVNLTGVGGGTSHELTVAFDGTNTKFKATTGGGTHIKLTRPGQLMISMNGVVQEPQNNTPSNGFGIEGNNVIVFSTAPTVLDTFWGHYLTSNLSSWELSDNKIDNFTGNGSTTTYTLSKTPANADNILVTIDGVTQYPSDSATTRAYTLNASVVTFTSAPALNAAIAVRHIGFAGGSGGGSGGGGVTGFYGRTGNVSVIRSDLQNTDIYLKNLTGVAATFTGNVSIGGTLTYTDVTNIDSVGIITAQSGVHIGVGGTTAILNAATGISSFTNVSIADSITHVGNTDTSIRFPTDDTFAVEVGGSEITRITSSGLGINVTPNRELHVKGLDAIVRLESTAATGRNILEFFDSSAAKGSIGWPASGNDHMAIQQGENADMWFATNDKERLRIDKDGNIEIGTQTDHSNTLKFADSSRDDAVTMKVDNSDDSDFDIVNNRSSGDITVATNSAEKLRITSTGLVGIGVTNPTKLLELKGTDPTIKLWDSSGDAYALLEGDSADQGSIRFRADPLNAGGSTHIRFDTDGSEKLRIDSSGNMGAGTNSPSSFSASDFVISKSADAGMTISVGAAGTTSTASIFFAEGTGGTGDKERGAIKYKHGDDYLAFHTNYDERLRILSDGDVWINPSSTSMQTGASLSIVSDKNVETGVDDMDNYHLVLKNPNNDTGEAIGLAFGITDTAAKVGAAILHERESAGSTGSMKFLTRPDNAGPPVERLRIANDGQFQIKAPNTGTHFSVGTGSHTTTMTVLDTTEPSAVGVGGKIIFASKYYNSTNTMAGAYIGQYKEHAPSNGVDEYRHALTFGSRDENDGLVERLRITSAGNVGIGTDNPQVKLTVSSTSPAVCDIHHIDGGTNDEARIILGALAANPPSNRGAGIAAVNNGAGHDLIIKCSASHSAGPTEKLRIHSNGDITVPSGSIKLSQSGQGINFHNFGSGTDIDSNLFDDYEEGSWTPVASRYTGGAISCSYNSRDGHYIKIGRMVYVQFNMNIASVSSQGSNINYIDGLPFEPDTAYRASGTALWNNAIAVDHISAFMVHNDFGGCIYLKQATQGSSIANFNWQAGSLSGSICYRV